MDRGSYLSNLIAVAVLYCRVLLLFLNTMDLPQYILLSSNKYDAIYPFLSTTVIHSSYTNKIGCWSL